VLSRKPAPKLIVEICRAPRELCGERTSGDLSCGSEVDVGGYFGACE
jgi:hypothetical protein